MSSPEQKQPETLSPADEAFLQAETEARDRASKFAETLDPEQRQAFEDIFSPIGQVLIQEAREDGNTDFRNTQFGLFPTGGEMTPIQNSVLALMAADREDRTAQHLPKGDEVRVEHELEAARLRRLAIKVRE